MTELTHTQKKTVAAPANVFSILSTIILIAPPFMRNQREHLVYLSFCIVR